jgi:hypothetical protein
MGTPEPRPQPIPSLRIRVCQAYSCRILFFRNKHCLRPDGVIENRIIDIVADGFIAGVAESFSALGSIP